MDYLVGNFKLSSLPLQDLMQAHESSPPHLMHKANMEGTAVGRDLIWQSDSFPNSAKSDLVRQKESSIKKSARTLEKFGFREYSWLSVVVFVSQWIQEESFGHGRAAAASDFIPKTIYLDDGRSVPICVEEVSPVGSVSPHCSGRSNFPEE